MMTIEELNIELQELVDHTVTYVRIAANSILIYFFGEPGDSTVVSFFIDPTWRFQQQGKVIVGSYDLQIDDTVVDTTGEFENEFQRLASIPLSIKHSILERVSIDLDSGDLSLEFSDVQVLRSFANSAFDDKDWTFRNTPKGITAFVSPLGINVVLRSPERRKLDAASLAKSRGRIVGKTVLSTDILSETEMAKLSRLEIETLWTLGHLDVIYQFDDKVRIISDENVGSDGRIIGLLELIPDPTYEIEMVDGSVIVVTESDVCSTLQR